MPYAAATPYPWPYNGDLRPENTALVVIDMQTDFCGKGGYIDLLGYDISNSRACIEPIQRVLTAMRAKGITSSTRERDTVQTWRIYLQTSAGVRAVVTTAARARASPIAGRAVSCSCAANRAGS